MQLSDLLGSGPHACGPATTLAEAAAAMEEADLGSLAVVEGLTLLGLITERDLRRAMARGTDIAETTVAEVMGTDPDTFDADLDVWDAAAWMAESDYRHLPVVGDDGKLLGVVSLRDLLKALVDTV